MSAQQKRKALVIDGVSYDPKTGEIVESATSKKRADSPRTQFMVAKKTPTTPKVIEGEVLASAKRDTPVPKKSKPASIRVPSGRKGLKSVSKKSAQSGRYGSLESLSSSALATVRIAFSEFSKFGAAVGAIILVAGYVFYLNLDNISLRVAANRAGFDAEVPSYSVAEYDLDRQIDSAPGIITLSFEQGGQVGYTITERQSDWDSASLLHSHVERKASTYQTFQKQGLTLYVYNGNNATWVSGGIWYDLEAMTEINVQDLLEIAASI